MSTKSLASGRKYTLQRFNSTSAVPYVFVAGTQVNVQVLVVAGGGGAGWDGSGGGGAGGLNYSNTNYLYTGNNYTITIGAGGAFGTAIGINGANGTNSSIVTSTSTIVTNGGGGGGAKAASGYNGASGGGSGHTYTSGAGTGTAGQGNNGAAGGSDTGGGGGGAGAAGTAGGTNLGAGGAGLYYSISGSNTAYAGGGGGGTYQSARTPNSGGAGGGGTGGAGSTAATSGSANTGGGGGGAGNATTGGNPGSGGSGTVIINYPAPQQFTGGTITNVNNLAGSNIVHTFTTSGTLTALATPIDTYFPQTTLLLHGYGTNGANNTVFLDNNGANTYIPFNGTYSNYFKGSADYLSCGNNPNLTIGTSDFTFEFWFYINSSVPSTEIEFFESQTTNSFVVYKRNTSAGLSFRAYTGTDYLIQADASITPNAWHHVVVTRTGGTTSAYFDGTRTFSQALSTNYAAPTASYTIGGRNGGTNILNGYISNMRLIVGSSIYSGATITVPTSPLTAVTGTQLLTAQSPIFVDNSTNNLLITPTGNPLITAGGNPITPNGKPLQGTFSPFSQTGWSNYFNGSSYISVPYSSSFAFTGDFTVEMWVNYSAHGAYGGLIANATSGASWVGWQLIFDNTTNNIRVEVNNATLMTSSTTLPLNQWVHVAWVRSGSNLNLYFNGVSVATATSSATFDSSSSPTYIGVERTPSSYITGYISNVRVIKGTAVYTSNFTPSITPLTAITNTALLTCQSNRFIDNSTNALTITQSGTPSVQAFSPLSPSAAYSNTVVGGSLYFNGSSDYLTTTSSTNLTFGTGDFTIEAFVYTNSSSTQRIISGPSNACEFLLINTGSNVYLDFYDGVADNSTGTGNTVPLNAWNHVAVTRSGTTMRLFINGVLSGTTTNSTNLTTSQYYIGRYGASALNYFSGYIANLRILKGIVLYTNTFTPPTAPLTAVTGTQLLLSATNAGIIDQTAKNDITTYGSAAISNTQSKFGGTSIYFNGTTDYLALPVSNFLPAVNTYTIEFWMYPLAYPGGTNNVSLYNVTNAFVASYGSLFVQLYGSGNIRMEVRPSTGGTNVQVTTSGTVSLNTWSHIAVVVNAGAATIYINGSSSATGTVVVMDGTQTFSAIGALNNTTPSNFYNGYLDDIRITKGIARYTSNFTPPTSAFLDR